MYEKLKERLTQKYQNWFDEIEKYSLTFEISEFFNDDDFKQQNDYLVSKLNAAMLEWDI